MKIAQIIARELYDAQGWPTIQCEIVLDSGEYVTAMVPSGRSVGRYEAVELRDQDARRGVRSSIEMIERIIAPLLIGQEPKGLELDLQMIELDGTPNKSYLGANTMLAVSKALYRAEAVSRNLELYELFAFLYNAETVMMPIPLLNVINGGAHADNNLTIQEFMIVPFGAPTFRSGLELGVQVYHELGRYLKKLGKSTAVGLEGGYACQFESNYEALDILTEVITQVNQTTAATCMIALDMAASEWAERQPGLYRFNNQFTTSEEMIAFYQNLIERYPIYSLEDPLGQDDWHGWQMLTQALSTKVQLVGDDLFVTDVPRIAKGIEEQSATAALIKPNQVGTIAETLQAIALCKNEGLNTMISHRSADTEDTFIADLAVGTSAGQIKAGAPCRSERMAKYNRLLVIEDTLTFAAERG